MLKHIKIKNYSRVQRTSIVLISIMAAGLSVALLYLGFLQFNYPSSATYPVRGVDVSHHQGYIHWPEIAKQGMDFAYIKATEGAAFKDPQFARNWREARHAGMAVGAYHFFSASKTGAEQAANFIQTVPAERDSLPPVLDVECAVVPEGLERDAIRRRIAECLANLATHYGKAPVIYTTYEAYQAYIQGAFLEYPLWIRSIFTAPDNALLQRDWLFWQYSSRGRLAGLSGPERFIDLNVFNGTREHFTQLHKQD